MVTLLSLLSGQLFSWCSTALGDSMFPIDFRLVSVFCVLGDTVDTVMRQSLGAFGVFPNPFPRAGAYRGPCSVSWCGLRSTENLDSGCLRILSLSGFTSFILQSIEALAPFHSFFYLKVDFGPVFIFEYIFARLSMEPLGII